MRPVIAIFKLFGFLGIIAAYFVVTFPFYCLAKFFRYEARKVIASIMQWHGIATLWVFGIKVNEINKHPKKISGLIISNHLSYIDVVIMAALNPSCFVTSVEIKSTFFLGQICEASGCLYVERRDKSNLDNEIIDITNALESGLNVTIFPEATSTNGESVKRFKRPLFQAAINSGVQVYPMTINYRTIDQEIVNIKNRDLLFWYDDMSFAPHFWSFLNTKSIDVDITYGEIISPCGYVVPQDLATLGHSSVGRHYQPITT